MLFTRIERSALYLYSMYSYKAERTLSRSFSIGKDDRSLISYIEFFYLCFPPKKGISIFLQTLKTIAPKYV